jgi:hypothetical protein
MIINSTSERDYVATYSCRADSASDNSIYDYQPVKLWVRKHCKLLKVLTIYLTVTPGVAGSSPVRSASFSLIFRDLRAMSALCGWRHCGWRVGAFTRALINSSSSK